MANTKRDGNRVPTLLGVSSVDGSTLIPIQALATGHHGLKVDDGTDGTDLDDFINDPRDQNYKVAFWAVSSEDGVTPVAVYCDADGKLLINSGAGTSEYLMTESGDHINQENESLILLNY